MSKLFYSVLLFGICLQCSAYLFNVFQILPQQMVNGNITGITSTFSIAHFNSFTVIGAASGAAIIGIVSLLLKQNTFAIFGMILWAIAMFIPLVGPFFLAIPTFFASLQLPGTVTQPIIYGLLTPVVAFALFWFLWQAVSGRYD